LIFVIYHLEIFEYLLSVIPPLSTQYLHRKGIFLSIKMD